jgi:hypothetical protein
LASWHVIPELVGKTALNVTGKKDAEEFSG